MNRAVKLILSVLILMAMISRADASEQKAGQTTCPYKVYVVLGFHTSFYHSWRGDTPDEAGFGTDIRLVREIIKMMDQANAEGKKARGYWDFDVYWTLENIIPKYAPDIITGIKRRVDAGMDEVLPGPYNNGANHAATEDEFRAAVAWSLENPYGSGLKQLFGKVTPIYRPQEGMYTTGQNRILLEEGIQGAIFYYSTIPFDNLAAFIPTLLPEQRYNPLWMRSTPGEKPIILFQCVSPGDVVNYISLERWLLDLHKLQTSGQVKSDLAIHINFDADAETWIPLNVPKGLAWFPNTGGLVEYINAVNKYPWADFAVPSEYLKSHPPKTEILVRQDLADGAFDGNYSWSEKMPAMRNWTMLEKSRLHTYRAVALSKRVSKKLAQEIDQKLWQGKDSSFFQRLIGLTTTHFGMSTPVINEERQAKAEKVIGAAEKIAFDSEKSAAGEIKKGAKISTDAVYRFELYNYARGKNVSAKPARMLARIPLIIPKNIDAVAVQDSEGNSAHSSMVNVKTLVDGSKACEIWFVAELGPEERKSYRVVPFMAGPKTSGPGPNTLRNDWLELSLDENSGISSFKFQDQEIGGSEFLKPFITYRTGKNPETFYPANYRLDPLEAEDRDELDRVRLKTEIPMQTPDGVYHSNLTYTFTIFDQLPFLLAEVEANYGYTPPRDMIHSVAQKLRRLLDLRWIEVAPFQLNPAISAPAEKPLRVWKHNYLEITSFYDLNYGQINPKNKNIDSFNHQVTAGWVAITNQKSGLLLAENAEVMTTMAFCPMRLREIDGIQHLSLNPFGSYFGKQLDYTNAGGNGVGTALATLASGSLKPNGPSFNGQTVKFSLILAPYSGDQPPAELQDAASAFFYPFGVVYLQTPAGIDAVVPEDINNLIAAKEKQEQMMSTAPLPLPTAFLANPSDSSVDLVWDPPRDERVTGYEIRWQHAERAQDTKWQTEKIGNANRFHIPDLKNDQIYLFQMRALAQGRESDWTPQSPCSPGPVKKVSLLSAASGASPAAILKVVYYGIVHALTTR